MVFRLKELDDRVNDYKLALQPLLDQPMTAEFCAAAASILHEKFQLVKGVTDASIALYCDGGVFDRKVRLRMSSRLAFFYSRLSDPVHPLPIGRFMEFSEKEELFVEIVGVGHVPDVKRPTVDLRIFIKTGTPAGTITTINMSYGACYRLARLLGYNLRHSYDMESPWMLNYLQCRFITRDNGHKFTIKDTLVNSYQQSINREIIKRRCECPIDAPVSCLECPRRNGPFAPQTNYCEGAVKR